MRTGFSALSAAGIGAEASVGAIPFAGAGKETEPDAEAGAVGGRGMPAISGFTFGGGPAGAATDCDGVAGATAVVGGVEVAVGT